MNSNVKTAIFWVVLICIAVLLWTVVKHGKGTTDNPLMFSQFMYQAENGKVKQVTISGNEVRGEYHDGTGLKTTIPLNYPDIYKILREKNVAIDIKDAGTSNWVSILINAVPFVLL